MTWTFADSYDFAPSTKDNPLSVEARVVYGIDTAIMCPQEPCSPPSPIFQFRYYSHLPMQLLGYNICDGISCIKNEGFVTYTITKPGLSGHPEQWGGGTIGNVPWKIGDTVHIRVKVEPVTINDSGNIIPQSDKMMFVDLGESKIIPMDKNRDG